ncbi:MAG: zinc-dependent alcohol dehydrogenase family protein [Bacteroidota bacterium]
MKAMLLRRLGDFTAEAKPLRLSEIPTPVPSQGEALVRVTRCAVCHTELDEIEGRTPPSHLPVILGHQVVGIVEEIRSPRRGRGRSSASDPLLNTTVASSIRPGERVGVAWIASACGHCEYCRSGRENLCPDFIATGRDVDGGYAEYMTVRSEFVHSIPDALTDSEAAPLLCAGAIGYRSLALSSLEDGGRLGLMGFGGSNHLVLKAALFKYPRSPVYVFSRSAQEREFALSLGAAWAGEIDETPPELLDAVIDTTPVWKPDLQALKRLRPGGRLVINAIRKQATDQESLRTLDYPSQLWMEKEIKSVANVTRQDVREFLQLAGASGIKPDYQEYELEAANQALLELKQGRIRGAKVLRVG